MKSATYKDSGVDITKGNEFVSLISRMVKQTWGQEVISSYGAFSAMFALNPKSSPLFSSRIKDPVLIACTDGVGTKLKIAEMLNKHDTVGIDLVAMNVNDLIVCGAAPLFFLDYLATGKLEPKVMAQVVEGISRGCLDANCSLIGGETAEMPGFYEKAEYDIAGFSVGIVDRGRILDPKRISKGDIILGLASSGLHSNGYSLARKVIFDMAGMAPETHIPELGETIGSALLTPTRIYVRAVHSVLPMYPVKRVISGISHITGGGPLENIARILPPGCTAELDCRKWKKPPIFSLLQKKGKIENEEMFRVFNMGIGLAVIVKPYYANAVKRSLEKAGETVWKIGRIVKGSQTVTLKHIGED